MPNNSSLTVKDMHAIESVPGKLPGIDSPDRRKEVTAQYSDLDIYRHVNAVKYIEWIQDFYDDAVYDSQNVSEFQINYQLETRYGEKVDIRMKKGSGKDPFDYYEGIRTLDQKPAFRARIRFGQFK